MVSADVIEVSTLDGEVILDLHVAGHGEGVSGGMLQEGESDSKPGTPWRGQLLPLDVGTHQTEASGAEGGPWLMTSQAMGSQSSPKQWILPAS